MTFVQYHSDSYDNCIAWSSKVDNLWKCYLINHDTNVPEILFEDEQFTTKESADMRILGWIRELEHSYKITHVRIE